MNIKVSKVWSKEEDEFLRANYLKKWPIILDGLPGRARVAVRSRAFRLGLEMRSEKSDAYNWERAGYIKALSIEFLDALKEERNLTKAYKKSGFKDTYLHWLEKIDRSFRQDLLAVKKYLDSTIKCGGCGRISPNKEEFHTITSSGRCGTCRDCQRKRDNFRRNSSLEERFKYALRRCRNTDQSCGRKFDLDLEYVFQMWDQQRGRCFYSGAEMQFDSSKDDRFLVSIDRICNTKGHVKGNVVLCTWPMNHFKGKLNAQEFYDVCANVAENLRSKYDRNNR